MGVIQNKNFMFSTIIEVINQSIPKEKNINIRTLGTTQRISLYVKDVFYSCISADYRRLKSYINSKLLRLEELSKIHQSRSLSAITGGMTMLFKPKANGVVFKDQIAMGFSDEVFLLKNHALYIITPVYNSFANRDNPYDITRMYKIPEGFFKESDAKNGSNYSHKRV